MSLSISWNIHPMDACFFVGHVLLPFFSIIISYFVLIYLFFFSFSFVSLVYPHGWFNNNLERKKRTSLILRNIFFYYAFLKKGSSILEKLQLRNKNTLKIVLRYVYIMKLNFCLITNYTRKWVHNSWSSHLH